MENPKLALIPSGYKSGKVYSILPVNGVGDFDFSRNTESSRVNKEGLIETVSNNVPKLDWLNSDCPSLLLEPQRANNFTYSEELNQSVWFKSNSTITTNQIIAPDGTMTADKLTSTLSGGGVFRFAAWQPTQKTISIFVKKNSSSTAEIFNANSGSNRVVFDLDNRTITTQGGSMTGQIENFGSGWFRISATHTATGSQTFGLKPGTNQSLFVWGGQSEDASYPTSYIKTIGSAVTRLIDNSHLLNQTLFTDYPFTVYAKAKIDAVGNTVFGLNNTSSNQYYLLFYFPNSSQVSVGRATIGFNDFDNYNFSYSVGDTIKVIIAFISEIEYKLYINGNEIAHVTNGTSIPFNHDDISLGQLRITGDTGTRNSINEFRVYDRVLTEAEAIQLTTI